jgi:allantoinase
VYRPDLASRTPDLVNENFRVYLQSWGNLRVGRLFKDLGVPLTTSHMLPLSRGVDEQKAYIRDTLNLIAATTGVKSSGWSSPSVYANADTMQAMAAAGITYTLDGMDSDIVSRLSTPDGPLVLLPYPVVTVDMGQNLARMKSPTEIAALWLDYVLELAEEARGDPAREATTVVVGIHPFVVGTPDGAAALRRVLAKLKTDSSVWLTDTEAILKAADGK